MKEKWSTSTSPGGVRKQVGLGRMLIGRRGRRREGPSAQAIDNYNAVPVAALSVAERPASYVFLGEDRRAMSPTPSNGDAASVVGSTKLLVPPDNTQTAFKQDGGCCGGWWERTGGGWVVATLGGGWGAVARLPAMAAVHGGAPFLAAYGVLAAALGLPLALLEVALGQLAQGGPPASAAAVPLAAGVAHVQLLASGLLCLYLPLYVGLALFHLAWLARGPPPFHECAVARMTHAGYRPVGISGDECLAKTFLASPVRDPTWFGIYVALLAVVWGVAFLCLFRQRSGYVRAANCLLLVVVACLGALGVHAALGEAESGAVAAYFAAADWAALRGAGVWWAALEQVLLGAPLGAGSLAAAAGRAPSGTDPLWAAAAGAALATAVNAAAVVSWAALAGPPLPAAAAAATLAPELLPFTAVYERAAAHPGTAPWAALHYVALAAAGLLSLLAAAHTLLGAVRALAPRGRRLWAQAAALLCGVGATAGALALLAPGPGLAVARCLERRALGPALLLGAAAQAAALAYLYGPASLALDAAWLRRGRPLPAPCRPLWLAAPAALAALAAWALAALPLAPPPPADPDLPLYAAAVALVLLCALILLLAAAHQVYIQVDYNLCQKLSSAVKPRREWGPADPMLRHAWVQWRAAGGGAGAGDFTLRRRGTRDYTHSVRTRRAPPAAAPGSPAPAPTAPPLHVVSITDALDSPPPSAAPPPASDSTSEGYGTIRHGPYVIADSEFDHVCWRRSSAHEDATEL